MPPKRNSRSTSSAANHNHGTRASAKKAKTGKKDAPKIVAKATSKEEFEITVPPVPEKDNVVTPEKSKEAVGFTTVIPNDFLKVDGHDAFVLYTDNDESLAKLSALHGSFEVKWWDNAVDAERHALDLNHSKWKILKSSTADSDQKEPTEAEKAILNIAVGRVAAASAVAAASEGAAAVGVPAPLPAAAAAAASAVPAVAAARTIKAAPSQSLVSASLRPAKAAPKTMEEKLAAMREAKVEARGRGYVLKVLVFPVLNGKHVVAVDLLERTNQQQYWQFKPTDVSTAVSFGGLGDLRFPHMEFFTSLTAGGFRRAPYGPNEARQNSKGWDTFIMYGIITANVFQTNTGDIGTSIGRSVKALFRDNNFKTFYVESLKLSNQGLMKYFDKKDVGLYKDLEEAPINVADKQGLNVLFLDNTIAEIMKVVTGKDSPSEWSQEEREYAFQNGVVPDSIHAII